MLINAVSLTWGSLNIYGSDSVIQMCWDMHEKGFGCSVEHNLVFVDERIESAQRHVKY